MPHELSVEDEVLLRMAQAVFTKRYGGQPTAAARAPGRVNLIGDHVDYCDGFVLPVALQFSTVVAGAYNNRPECKLTSILESGEVLVTTFPVHTSTQPLQPGTGWSNYVKGVIAHFPHDVQGFDAVIVSNIPTEAGLSSSAALEVAMFTFLEALTGINVDNKNKALLCQKAEHTYPGMPCGIMDQFISVMAKKDHALLIDCRSLESKQIQIPESDVVIVVTNSNVRHQLTGSEYPQRRAQCEQAVAILGRVSMRNITVDDVNELKKLNADAEVIRRTEHVISETLRTIEAAQCLEEGNFERVGELFYESSDSLSKFMEVSCPEIDELIDINRTVGVLGARLTGGGFGGCTVSLVRKDQVNKLKEEIRSRFRGNPDFFECRPGNGAEILYLK